MLGSGILQAVLHDAAERLNFQASLATRHVANIIGGDHIGANALEATAQTFTSADRSSRATLEHVLDSSEKGAKGTDFPGRIPEWDRPEFLDRDIHYQITCLEREMGLTSEARRLLEASLYIDRKFWATAVAGRQPEPHLIFGADHWASYLHARLYARRYGNQDLTVSFIRGIHKRLAIRHDPEAAGRCRIEEGFRSGKNANWGRLAEPLTRSQRAAIAENPVLTYAAPFDARDHGLVISPVIPGQEGAREIQVLPRPLTDSEIAAVDADPLRGYQPPGIERTYNSNGVIVFPRFVSSDSVSLHLQQSVCDWYNSGRGDPSNDLYQLSAGTQKRIVSPHVLADWNGRTSRIVMNWSLENRGLSPSVIDNFDNDMFTPLRDWTESVRAGSDRYQQWAHALDNRESRGEPIDPVSLFGLEAEAQRFRELQADSGDKSPSLLFPPGEDHDHTYADHLWARLEGPAEPPSPPP
ncbi:hypothetical protein ABZV91_29160 [Nocardia sp. NPDC004568]|uniref:hypothetical protein n=1 Tax=Nocardia sp. NPDC004568 TaxID=3154551 RepID=UPI0033B89BD7